MPIQEIWLVFANPIGTHSRGNALLSCVPQVSQGQFISGPNHQGSVSQPRKCLFPDGPADFLLSSYTPRRSRQNMRALSKNFVCLSSRESRTREYIPGNREVLRNPPLRGYMIGACHIPEVRNFFTNCSMKVRWDEARTDPGGHLACKDHALEGAIHGWRSIREEA